MILKHYISQNILKGLLAILMSSPLFAQPGEVKLVDVDSGWAANSVNAVVFRKNSLASFKQEQYEALHEQIALAIKYKLPLVLHTRNAITETIDVIKEYRGTGLKGIFHCFGGTEDEARQIIALDFLLGIGGGSYL